MENLISKRVNLIWKNLNSECKPCKRLQKNMYYTSQTHNTILIGSGGFIRRNIYFLNIYIWEDNSPLERCKLSVALRLWLKGSMPIPQRSIHCFDSLSSLSKISLDYRTIQFHMIDIGRCGPWMHKNPSKWEKLSTGPFCYSNWNGKREGNFYRTKNIWLLLFSISRNSHDFF